MKLKAIKFLVIIFQSNIPIIIFILVHPKVMNIFHHNFFIVNQNFASTIPIIRIPIITTNIFHQNFFRVIQSIIFLFPIIQSISLSSFNQTLIYFDINLTFSH